MSKPAVRCAIYTRKSSDEGLDQAFNSLDAQHEACAAYIASQRHEGWKMLPRRYDDGGVSGGTLDRPALQQLLADMDAGRIDMVVVYKIDRLTRSLPDFAKLVERLDAAGCSFVSVTQAFNTSSSMGRLTLNVLLSFAQFEREVTAERIRDKIAASKKKGLWMGGIPPIGYDPHPDKSHRELVVNEQEADAVRQIFGLYVRHRCLNAATEAANADGLRSKRHVFASGRRQGGNPFSRGQVHRILTNPIYLGLIRHKEKTWPGAHPAVIEQQIWDQVQKMLRSASMRKRGVPVGKTNSGGAPLKGKLRDETGDRLTPTHTQRRGKRLTYYVSNRLISGGPDPSGWRLPGPALENAVTDAVVRHLEICAQRHICSSSGDLPQRQAAAAAIARLAERTSKARVGLASSLISNGQIMPGRLRLTLDRGLIADASGLEACDLPEALLEIDRPFECRRRGVEMKIVAGDRLPAPDAILLKALGRAHAWGDALKSGVPLRRLAERDGYSARYIARITPLSGLSPQIQSAIVGGTQPVDLTLERILRHPLPLDWHEQERLLGFAG